MKNKQNQKGFTLIELIVVLAIMGIIGAMLVPSFKKMTMKSRVSTDVSSIQTLQRLVDSYDAEQSVSSSLLQKKDASSNLLTPEAILLELKDAGYLESATPTFKTGGSVGVDRTNNNLVLNVQKEPNYTGVTSPAIDTDVAKYCKENIKSGNELYSWIRDTAGNKPGDSGFAGISGSGGTGSN